MSAIARREGVLMQAKSRRENAARSESKEANKQETAAGNTSALVE